MEIGYIIECIEKIRKVKESDFSIQESVDLPFKSYKSKSIFFKVLIITIIPLIFFSYKIFSNIYQFDYPNEIFINKDTDICSDRLHCFSFDDDPIHYYQLKSIDLTLNQDLETNDLLLLIKYNSSDYYLEKDCYSIVKEGNSYNINFDFTQYSTEFFDSLWIVIVDRHTLERIDNKIITDYKITIYK